MFFLLVAQPFFAAADFAETFFFAAAVFDLVLATIIFEEKKFHFNRSNENKLIRCIKF